MSVHTTIIVNPISGRGSGGRSAPVIQEFVARGGNGNNFELLLTERPWHTAELARQAARQGSQVVVSAGGDGTANEVLNGLMQAKELDGRTAAMGILCVGRGNDFAFSMGLPTTLDSGLAALLEGRRSPIDVGRVRGGDYPQGRYFGNGVGVGFDAVVGFEALKLKRLSGFPSYIVAAMKTIFLYFKAPRVRLEYNNQEQELSALMVSIMNGRRMGGGFMMAPDSQANDGLLDVCSVQEVSKMRIFTLIQHFMKGTQATQPEIHMARTAALRVTAFRGTLPVHADGETICEAGQSIDVELLPAQIEMVGRSEG